MRPLLPTSSSCAFRSNRSEREAHWPAIFGGREADASSGAGDIFGRPIVSVKRLVHACLLSLWLVLLLPSSSHGAETARPSPSPSSLSTKPQDSTNGVVVTPFPDQSEDHQRLAPGDRVSFRVIEEKTEPKPLLVADSGELEVPYIGRIMAKERTCPDLAREIKQKLEEKYFHKATVVLSVELLNPTRGSVYLFGEVRAPGAQPIPSGDSLTLAKAIIRSGGFTDFADKRRVKVTRETGVSGGGTNQTFSVDIGRVLQRGQLQQDLKLEPGDIIYVPTRLVNF